MKPKSILEVEILLWYSYSIQDFPNIKSNSVNEAIDKFCKLGIMERISDRDRIVKVKQDALDVYVKEVLNVNLPIIKWTCNED